MLHPWELTCPLKSDHFSREYIWTNHRFSGDMLVFRGVSVKLQVVYPSPRCHFWCVTKAWTPPIQQGFHGGIAPRGRRSRRSPGPRGSGEAARGRKAPGIIFFEKQKMPSNFLEGWRLKVVFFVCFFVFFFGGWVGGGNWIWVGFVFSCLSSDNLKYVASLKSLDAS